jgi:diadenosine tetraphosphate (Ap4A) HIT family hydrolase
MSDPSCKVCSKIWPTSDHLIADLGLSTAYLHDDQFFPGWSVVVFKRHATELFDLAPTERIQLMEEVSRLAKVLHETYAARKMNYSLLGNQTPHLHWHLIPRLPNDPAPLEPVWTVPHSRVVLPIDQMHVSIARIKSQLRPVV